MSETNKVMTSTPTITVSNVRTTLARAPVGLLMTDDGSLIVKTEYRTENGAIQAFIVESGEMFWGDQPQTVESQLKTRVRGVIVEKADSKIKAGTLSADQIACSKISINTWVYLRDGRYYDASTLENDIRHFRSYEKVAAFRKLTTAFIVELVNQWKDIVYSLEEVKKWDLKPNRPLISNEEMPKDHRSA